MHANYAGGHRPRSTRTANAHSGDETPLRLPCDRIVTHRIPSESTRNAMAIMQSGEIMAAVVSLRGLSATDRAL
jgi:hypothetical protein